MIAIFVFFLVAMTSSVRCHRNFGAYHYYTDVIQRLQECTYNSPLGMSDGYIHESQISSSSNYPSQYNKGCHPNYARVYQPNGLAWCAKYKSSSEWLQVDLGVPSKVTGFLVQGRSDSEEWVTSFMVSYSLDAYYWHFVSDQYGSQKTFEGNVDSYSVRTIFLDDAIVARYLKFHTSEWHRHPSMRVEVIGCQTCRDIISLPPNCKMSSSSTKNENESSCKTEDGLLISNKAWCAKTNDENQWLQFDLGPPTLVTGVVTKGRMDVKKRAWVKSYKLSFSNDSSVGHFYNEGAESVKIFHGNKNGNDSSYNFLSRPFVARYIRIHPVTWHRHISMRAGILGCPFDGICSRGFMQVNNHASCVENLAYQKESFVNNRRHSKRHVQNHWVHGQAAKAVDGEIGQSCIMLDNSFVEKPIWMVDLGKKTTISGVVIVTWNGVSRDYSSLTHYSQQKTSEVNDIDEYLSNLDKLSVYVHKKQGRHASLDAKEGHFCGQLTRHNNALLKPRLHFQCAQPIEGRYVYVEAQGVPERRSKLFGAILCEVMVYE